jgi:hypothetical protein
MTERIENTVSDNYPIVACVSVAVLIEPLPSNGHFWLRCFGVQTSCHNIYGTENAWADLGFLAPWNSSNT